MTRKTLRLIVTGGGTGGHITPGLAVIEALRRRDINLQVLWIGAAGRSEEDLVPRYNVELQTLKIKGLHRSLSPSSILGNLRSLVSWLTLQPVLKARAMIRDFQPDFILGTGGYACAPVLVAARWLGIHAWILEQNSVPGLTVKLLARLVDGVGVAYDSTQKMLPMSSTVHNVGNPVSPSFMTISREEARAVYPVEPDIKTLLILGGSLGSGALNQAIRELLLIGPPGSAYQGWQILHSVGKNKHDEFVGKLGETVRYHPYPYLYRPDAALALADLVLCRGGALTLAEITARGVPALVVPWPGAVRNHQYTNAREMAAANACELIPETKLSGVLIAQQLSDFRNNPGRLGRMAQAAASIGRPNAADTIAQYILSKKHHR